MKWVIQEDVFDENYTDNMEEALADLGLARGSGYEIINYIPFAEPSAYLPVQQDNDVIVYGSINLLKQVQQHTKWKPGAGVTWENYKCSVYYPHLRSYLLNDHPEFIKLKDIEAKMEWLDRPMFIRPDGGDKTWVGGVYDPYEAKRHAEYVMSLHSPDMLMLIAEPKNVQWESRYFCIEDEVITGSIYRILNKKITRLTSLGNSTETGAFLEEVLDQVKYRPDPIYTLDVCSSEGKLYIMELSAFNCAGFYAADIKKLVTRVHNYYTEKNDG